MTDADLDKMVRIKVTPTDSPHVFQWNLSLKVCSDELAKCECSSQRWRQILHDMMDSAILETCLKAGIPINEAMPRCSDGCSALADEQMERGVPLTADMSIASGKEKLT